MARHNEITMYGQVIQEPRLLYNTSDETNPDRRLLRVMSPLVVLRGIRDFGAVDKRIRMDIPIVVSQNPKIMKLMKTWEIGDMIELRGTLATVNITKNLKCSECGKIETGIQGMLSFINPIWMKTTWKKLSPEDGNKDMRRNSEISNRITILGKACIDPEIFRTNKGQLIVNYQLDVQRKYRIKEDDESNKHDFPFVKSYGFVADNDRLAIKKDAMVFIDGAIQTRDYKRKHVCPFCGAEYEFIETATEIVPYSTEYLTGCLTMEEIELEKQKEAAAEAALVKAEVFGENDDAENGE